MKNLQTSYANSLKIYVPSAWKSLEDVIVYLDYTVGRDTKNKRFYVMFHAKFTDQICVVKNGQATFPIQKQQNIINYASFPKNPNLEKILEIIFNSLDYWLEDYPDNSTLSMFGQDLYTYLYESLYDEYTDFPEYSVESLGEK